MEMQLFDNSRQIVPPPYFVETVAEVAIGRKTTAAVTPKNRAYSQGQLKARTAAWNRTSVDPMIPFSHFGSDRGFDRTCAKMVADIQRSDDHGSDAER